MYRHIRNLLRIAFVCALTLIPAVAPDVFAQTPNPRISVLGGASLLGGERTFIIGTDVITTGYGNGPKLGFRGTFDLDSHWAAEVMYAFSSNDLTVTEENPPLEREFDVRVHQITGNALYFFAGQESMFRPFATVGLGISRFSMTGDSKALAGQRFLNQPAIVQDENKFAFNLGAGVEARIRDRLGVRFDFRDYISGLPRFGLSDQPPSPGAAFYPISGSINNVELSGSVVIFFGQ
jgi:opacity protein-like surface antigen